jgi:hypothetical protein
MSSTFCSVGLSCVRSASGAPATCVASTTTAGAACDFSPGTQPGCDVRLGLSCNAISRRCEPQPLAQAGEPCGIQDDGSQTVCSGGGLCVRPNGSSRGVCKTPVADGQSCDVDSGPPCLVGSRCVVSLSGGTAGTCQEIEPQACR